MLKKEWANALSTKNVWKVQNPKPQRKLGICVSVSVCFYTFSLRSSKICRWSNSASIANESCLWSCSWTIWRRAAEGLGWWTASSGLPDICFSYFGYFSAQPIYPMMLVFVVCMYVYPCVVQCACEFSQSSRKGTRFPDPGVTRGCESLGMGSGNKTRSSAILSSALNFQVIPPGPSSSLWHKFCDML